MTRSTGQNHARPQRLALFLLLSGAVHAALLFGNAHPALRTEGGERYEVLSAQLAGNARATQVRVARHSSPSAPPTTGATPTEQAAPSTHAATALPDTGQTEQETEAAANRARAQVIHDLARHFHYPAIARLRGWEGRVLLGFRINADGRLQEHRVVHTSGFAVLDEAALDSLRRVERVADIRGMQLSMQIPVLYRLTEGH